MRKLVITQPFGDYKVGDEVTNADEIAKLEADHPNRVVPVIVAEVKDAEPAPKPPAKS